MPTLQHNGATINYRESGEGDVLLLLHAAGSTSGQWRGFTPHFEDRYRVIAPDLYGHGKSDFWQDPKTLTHDDQGDVIGAVLDQLGIERFHMIAHSYGGGSGIRHLLKRPETVRSLVVIEPMIGSLLFERKETQAICEVKQMWDGFLESLDDGGPEAAWKGFLDFRNGPGTWENYPEKTRNNFLSRTEGHVANIYANKSNPTTMAELATITAPTLAIRSERPTHFDLRMVELVAEAIPGCEFITLPDTEHMCPLTHPDLVAEAVVKHLAKAA